GIAVWGAGEGPLERNSPALETLERLSRLRARLQIDASWMADSERKLLPREAVQADGPLAAVRGAEALLILGARPEYRRLDFAKVAPLMVRRLIFDARDWLDTGAPGMDLFPDYILATRPTWPPWLDPELQRFVEDLAERIPENQSLLLAPRNFHTFNPRGRWFLELNYFLFPRRLFLSHSIQASGTVGQFQAWIQDTLKRKTALGRALQEKKVNWLLTYDQWTDFRPKDWKLQSLGGMGR
ncbi:MAG: UDP binding domain-containing protein, partial [Planctomycetota bacterium]